MVELNQVAPKKAEDLLIIETQDTAATKLIEEESKRSPRGN